MSEKWKNWICLKANNWCLNHVKGVTEAIVSGWKKKSVWKEAISSADRLNSNLTKSLSWLRVELPYLSFHCPISAKISPPQYLISLDVWSDSSSLTKPQGMSNHPGLPSARSLLGFGHFLTHDVFLSNSPSTDPCSLPVNSHMLYLESSPVSSHHCKTALL